jgi:hypothetical protein
MILPFKLNRIFLNRDRNGLILHLKVMYIQWRPNTVTEIYKKLEKVHLGINFFT